MTTPAQNSRQILAPKGSAATPGFSFLGDNAVGFYAAGSGSLGVSVGGVLRVTYNTSGYVGINVSNPLVPLHVASTGVATIFSDNYTVVGGTYYGRQARGTIASPTSTQNGDSICTLGGRGYGSSGFSSSSTGVIKFAATGNFTDSSMPTKITFYTTPSGSIVNSLRVTITEDGYVGVNNATPTSHMDVGGTIKDSIGNVRSIPQNAQVSSYVLVATDNGKHISITTGGVTVPSGVFSAGDTVAIYNNSGSSQTITQGGSVTLRQVGTANTGNRTLALRGLATILCVASNEFVITGGGLT